MNPTRPTKIIQIITRLNIGGPAVYAFSLIDELSKAKYQNILVCGTVETGEGDMTCLAKDKGIQVIIIPKLGREISLINDLKSFLSLRKIIKQFKPDIVHTHTAKAGTLGRMAAMSLNLIAPFRKKIKTVHTFHGHVFHSYFKPLKTFVILLIERFLAKFTDRIITISSSQREDICHRFKIACKKKVQIIPLGFNLSSYKDCNQYREIVRKEYLFDKSSDKILVGMIGRLSAIKNHKLLFEAIKFLKDIDRIKEFQFIIIGDGELRETLIKNTADLGIEEAVIFTGWQKEMPCYYSALDAVVLTSKNEGTPVTLIEAMAASKPIIATAVGGVPDLLGKVEKKNIHDIQFLEKGILIPSGNSKALAYALLSLLENEEEMNKRSLRASQFVFEKHSIKKILDNMKLLYEELL